MAAEEKDLIQVEKSELKRLIAEHAEQKQEITTVLSTLKALVDLLEPFTSGGTGNKIALLSQLPAMIKEVKKHQEENPHLVPYIKFLYVKYNLIPADQTHIEGKEPNQIAEHAESNLE